MHRLLPLLLLALALPAPAAAQGVKRCTDAQGNTVFTDRSCASQNAVPKGAPAEPGGAYATGFAPRGFRRWRIERRLKNSRFDLFQDMARLRGIVYACYYGHWQPGLVPGDQDANVANPVHRQIGFTLPKHRVRGAGEMPITPVTGRETNAPAAPALKAASTKSCPSRWSVSATNRSPGCRLRVSVCTRVIATSG